MSPVRIISSTSAAEILSESLARRAKTESQRPVPLRQVLARRPLRVETGKGTRHAEPCEYSGKSKPLGVSAKGLLLSGQFVF